MEVVLFCLVVLMGAVLTVIGFEYCNENDSIRKRNKCYYKDRYK